MELRNHNRKHRNHHRNPCLTMHQPWASLLVHGIKRVEGRSWPAPIRGRLWIHAAGKVPDAATLKAMEDFYREIYALSGITDLKFPEEYPVSRLVGCVEVVGCVSCDELAYWQEVPEGVRLEALTDFCWLCENPKKLLNPLEMRGYKGVYDLERKMFEDAFRDLVPARSPAPIKFPLPNPRDPFSLKEGSLSVSVSDASKSRVEKSSSLVAAIAGARAAATQFSRKDPSLHAQTLHRRRDANESVVIKKLTSMTVEEKTRTSNNLDTESYRRVLAIKNRERSTQLHQEGNYSSHHQIAHTHLDKRSSYIGPSKIFADAVKGATSGVNFQVR
ncbi:hypothetical protein Dimus_021822 [Dionaea muscipula]